MIPDRFFYPLIVLFIAGLIALAVVFPQGNGEHSWGPFGYPTAEEQKAQDMAARHTRPIPQSGAPAAPAPAPAPAVPAK